MSPAHPSLLVAHLSCYIQATGCVSSTACASRNVLFFISAPVLTVLSSHTARNETWRCMASCCRHRAFIGWLLFNKIMYFYQTTAETHCTHTTLFQILAPPPQQQATPPVPWLYWGELDAAFKHSSLGTYSRKSLPYFHHFGPREHE